VTDPGTAEPGPELLLSPEEVMSPDFPRAVMGYDRLEVDYFLEVVAVQQKQLLARLRELEQAPPPAARVEVAEPATSEGARLARVLDRAAHLVGERRLAYAERRATDTWRGA
jgi:DivIVA domain-containing protein